MKFTFICIVIVLLSGSCISANLDVYPDLKFTFPLYNKSPHQSNYGSYFKWQKTPDPVRDYLESVKDEDYSKDDATDEKYEPGYQFYNEDYFPKASTAEALKKILNRYAEEIRKEHEYEEKMNYLKSEINDDMQTYPMKNKEEEQDKKTVTEKLHDGDESHPHKSSHEHYGKVSEVDGDENLTEETSFEIEESSKDDFAYVPSDPRYYENINGDSHYTSWDSKSLVPDESSDPSPIENQFLINQRNEDSQTHESATSVSNAIVPINDDSVAVGPLMSDNNSLHVYIIAIVAGISAAATVGLIAVGIGWYNLQKHVKGAGDVDYPAYGVTGPNKDTSPSGDRRLAQSAQMYHYQHQKQQIIAMENRVAGDRQGSISEPDSDEENEEGDYTVYECPGLAPTGEMEVKNPMYDDDPYPAQTPQNNTKIVKKK